MHIIISPIITEKSMLLAAKDRFTFRVSFGASKEKLKKEVAKRFGVDVLSVLTVIAKGKTKRMGSKRMERKTANYKKAIVQVKPGQKIGLFELGGK
ncbi:MAG TPA: 50S ribosomal protein L23 [Patescibacteria group bacterium]|nr:50S ribosomal protein L23 [Patescibacteria group bacterium]